VALYFYAIWPSYQEIQTMKIEFDYPRREWIQLKAYLFPYKARSELVQDFFDKVNKKTKLKVVK